MNKTIIKVLSVIFIVIVVFLAIRAITSSNKLTKSENTTREDTKIVFFCLGKADGIYIENNSKSMLIDTGLKANREELIQKLGDLDVKKLDYLLLTHGDKDHIGSASYILDEFEIGTLIQSYNIKDTKRQKRIEEVIDRKKIENIRPDKDMEFELGELKVKIFTPEKNYYEKDNDYSLVTLIRDSDLNYLFAGDAEEELLDETLKLDLPKVDLYKVAHHGRKNSNSEKISPKYSIITNSKEKAEVEKLLKDENSLVKYAFDEDIVCISDGKKLKFK